MDAIIKLFVVPSALISLSAIIGLVLFCFRLTRKGGAALCMTAFAGYMIFASGPVAFLLLGHLEYQIAPARTAEREGFRTIVLLAAYAEADDSIPLSSRINGAGAFRLLETLSLYQLAPESTVIVSGGGAVPGIMRDVLVSAGIPADHIVVDVEADSTFKSAQHLAGHLGASPFLLVTSAGHMPRAMGVFKKAGANPLAVPTHYMTRRNCLASQYLPSPLHLEYSDLAVSEYAAIYWYYLNEWL